LLSLFRATRCKQATIRELEARLAGAPMDAGAGGAGAAEEGDSGDVDVTIKLGMDFSEAGEEGSAARERFTDTLAGDIAGAAEISPERVHVREVAPGSVVAVCTIREAGEDGGVGAADVAAGLVAQAGDAASRLRQGAITRHCLTMAVRERPAAAAQGSGEAQPLLEAHTPREQQAARSSGPGPRPRIGRLRLPGMSSSVVVATLRVEWPCIGAYVTDVGGGEGREEG